MTDKKSFGSYIKQKRTEKQYSQKDLAELLYVSEGAVSKWERGVSYPDITLISDICRALDISEHELITASTDTDTRRLKQEAHHFRVIRGTWFWVPTIAYTVALLTCFICNLAVQHTLSWFFIVLAALLCAYTFIPNITCFCKSKKLLIFSLSTYLSLCLLLFTCAVYTGGLSWLLTACIGVLMGYTLLFVPLLLSKTKLSRFKFVISFVAAWGLTLLLLLNIDAWHPFRLVPAMLITSYAFIPAVFCTVICALRLDGFIKAGICTLLSTVAYYFVGHMVNFLFNVSENHYAVDFNNWAQHVSGNVHCIFILTFLCVSAVFLGIGILRINGTKPS